VAPITVTNSDMKVEGEGRIFFRGGKLVVMNSGILVNSESANSRIEVDATDMQLTTDSTIFLRAIGESDAGSILIGTGHLNNLTIKNSKIVDRNDGSGKGGEIQIKAANSITLEDKSLLGVGTTSSGDAGLLAIDTGSLSLTNSNIAATTSGSGNAGDIQIKATNSITLVSDSGLIVVTDEGSGDAGSLDIETGSLSLTNSDIGATTSGIGSAGEIQIKATNSITLEEKSQLITFTAFFDGDAGSVDIETGSLSLTNSDIGAGTLGIGNAGDVQIKAANSITLEENSGLSVDTYGSGDGGSVDIETGSLSLTNSSFIEAGAGGTGSAGQITITASEYINIVGEGSGIFSTSGDENFPDATGNAGTITIGKKPTGESMPVPTLTVTENGQINTSTFGAGEGGEIDINVNNLEITSGGVINSSTKGAGAGGTITMMALENINIDGGSLLANTLGTGQGGEIDIDTNHLELTQGGRIDSSSDSSGHAGTITITAGKYINLVGENSGIFGTASSSGNAGQIDIFAGDKLSVTTNSQISTSTESLGQGGEIKINTNQLELTQGGNIDSSSSGTGSAGKIAITASEYLKIFGEGSGIFSTASSSGDAGQINILAGGTPEDGVEIIPGSLFSAEAELLPHVRGGLVLENGGEISTSTSGQGNGGTITITSSKLRLNNAEITADNEVADFNQAGNIIIGAHQLDMSDSTISTSSTNADGGNILIGVRELNNKRITDSQIAATAGETGIGGNLEIRGPKYLILDSTNLKADADKGGNLTLDADVFIASTDSQIEASGVLQTPEHIDVGTISLLPSQGVDVSKMVKECTASDSKEEWSLKQVGYGKSKKKNGCHK
jgi:large exoprotein involved in heme utilization and adhesion